MTVLPAPVNVYSTIKSCLAEAAEQAKSLWKDGTSSARKLSLEELIMELSQVNKDTVVRLEYTERSPRAQEVTEEGRFKYKTRVPLHEAIEFIQDMNYLTKLGFEQDIRHRIQSNIGLNQLPIYATKGNMIDIYVGSGKSYVLVQLYF